MPLPALLICLVVGIADGDTLTARCDDQTLKIRLAEIDAPETSQPLGSRSKQSLSALCHGKPAKIRPHTTDRYGRTLAHVSCNGTDANSEQVRSGMAWVYDQYVVNMNLYGLQDEAVAARRGVWSEQDPTPPWKWRRGGK